MSAEKHYDKIYFAWQKRVGAFGAKVNQIKFEKLISNNLKVLDFGCGGGYLLNEFKYEIEKSGVEINEFAFKQLTINLGKKNFYNQSIETFNKKKKYDLVFTKGVLIHINPKNLQKVYKKMFELSSKYILTIEYYNPKPVSVIYRGHKDKLFKRDFAGEIMKKYKSLKLLDYGFIYHGDQSFPQDDMTWFLLKK